MTILLFAAAFCVLQRLTFLLRFPSPYRTMIWTPGALVFTALLLAPPRRWWVYFAGYGLGLFAGFYGDRVVPPAMHMLKLPIDCLAFGLGVWAVLRFGCNPLFGNLKGLTAFVVSATLLQPVGDQTQEVVIRFLFGEKEAWSAYVPSMQCAALGMLIATPALTLTLANGRAWLLAISWRRSAEIAALIAGLVAVGHVSFWMFPPDRRVPAMLFAPLPLLLWAAVSFELAGVSWALLVVAFQSTWGAIHGHGLFAKQAPADSVLQIQLFLLAISVPLMFLATVIRERRQAFLDLSRAEQEVRREYAQLASIYHCAPVGLAFVDTQLRYVSINDQLAEINGQPADAHLGRTVRQVLPDLADALEPIYRRVIETGQPLVDVEIQGVTASRPGEERSWLVSYFPIRDSQGTIHGVNTVVQEITERKQAEEARKELTHTSRLALMGEFTASIAHEINQPLGAILNYVDAAEILLESSPPAVDKARGILGNIRKDDLRASEVIRRLRALLKKRELEHQPLDLNEVVSDVVLLVRVEARRRGITVEPIPGYELPVVRGDKVHLQQVLLNLVFNGMEAMADAPGEKRVTVRIGVNENGSVEVAVSDTGPGVLPNRLPRLFDPFFSTKKEGMGLGLSIARSLVEAHGGQIWAENNPNGGATFRFTLPRNHPPNPEAGSTQEAPAGAYV
jgi:PAS domain S-box-containing protein